MKPRICPRQDKIDVLRPQERECLFFCIIKQDPEIYFTPIVLSNDHEDHADHGDLRSIKESWTNRIAAT